MSIYTGNLRYAPVPYYVFLGILNVFNLTIFQSAN